MSQLIKRSEKRPALAEQVREASHTKLIEVQQSRVLIPTGSTVLNLMCSGNPFGGFVAGKLVNIIGDSSSGKSLLTLTMLAEMCQDSFFDNYDLYYDDCEDALEFDIERLFGKSLASRIILDVKNGVPGVDVEERSSSSTSEDFYGNFLRVLKRKKPFVYIVDSWDSLATVEDYERAEEFAKENPKVKGTYGQSKPKLASEIFRVTTGELRDKEGLLVVISQTRDNLNAGMFGSTKIRAGGKALRFYSSHEIWLAVKKHEKTATRYGIISLVKLKKNKITGCEDELDLPILYNYGVDDTYSCIDFLLKNSYWKKERNTGSINTAKPFGRKTFEEMIEHVEKNNLTKELKQCVYECWQKIEAARTPNRKPKFE